MSDSNWQNRATEKTIHAAEAALADHKYVSAIDVLVGSGRLAPSHVEAWRKGRIPYLDELIQGNPVKTSFIMRVFMDWAHERGLNPSETVYLSKSLTPQPLQFSRSGDPDIERLYRTHFISPELSAAKRAKLEEKLSAPPDLVAYSIVRDSQCSQCKRELLRGECLVMEKGEPLCLECADLDHLVYLPRGDAALTRRATKYSALSVVVVRFSRARKRYERQGILVTEHALNQAEEECLEDTEIRARRRMRDEERRAEQDIELAEQMALKIRELYPGCPSAEAEAIAAHTAVRGSGRVGRSAAGRALDEDALRLAVIASIRHNHTNYDELLMRGTERSDARQRVREQIEDVLERWSGSKKSGVRSQNKPRATDPPF